MATHINFGRYQINGRLVPTIDVLHSQTPKADYASGRDQGLIDGSAALVAYLTPKFTVTSN